MIPKLGIDEIRFIITTDPRCGTLCLDDPTDRNELLRIMKEDHSYHRETIEPAVAALCQFLHGFSRFPLDSYREGYENGLTWPTEWIKEGVRQSYWEPGGPPSYDAEEEIRNRAWRQGWRDGYEKKRREGLPSRRPGERPEEFLATTKG
jgi:hypothetical protein